VNSRGLEKQWNAAPSDGTQNHEHCGQAGAGKQKTQIWARRRQRQREGKWHEGHASLGGEALSRIHGLLSPAVLTGLLGQLAADQCSSSRTPMCWPGICAGVPCIDEN
jgi:hypothetical protein